MSDLSQHAHSRSSYHIFLFFQVNLFNLDISVYYISYILQAQAQPVAPKPLPPQVQENAALKAEQEKINEMKANQELKNMLVKEVNDFQMELYKFCVKTRETQAKVSYLIML